MAIILSATNIVVTHAQKADAEKLPALPAPFQTYPDRKPFSAVQLGPGNTFSVSKVPKDYTLVSFTFSQDGRRLALGWESEKIELFDLQTKQRVSEYNSGVGNPLVLKFTPGADQLIVAGPHGRLSFLESVSGKEIKRWKIPPGKYKYDIQVVVIDPHGKWLAYADEESSKVLDCTGRSPVPLADLKDAGSIALSPDGSELWTVNRKVLTRFSTSTWQQTGEWPLQSAPINTSPVVVRAGASTEGQAAVAVPTSKGLLIYREPEMIGNYASDQPTDAVAFASAGRLFVNLSPHLTFLKPSGEAICIRSYSGRYDYSISDDGQWLALSQSGSVDLWRMDDLLRECAATSGM